MAESVSFGSADFEAASKDTVLTAYSPASVYSAGGKEQVGRSDERLSLHGVEPEVALGALLRTPRQHD
jgi:hypothetical protein